MELSCGSKTLKIILFGFNFLCLLFGIALIAVGVIEYTNYVESIAVESFEVLKPFGIVLIVLGCITVVIAFFGCCGTLQESSCMTLTYAIILFIIIVLEIIFVVVFFAQPSLLMKEAEKEITEIYKNNNVDDIAVIQRFLKCCGQHKTYYNENQDVLPKSCCPEIPENENNCTKKNAYPMDCMEAFSGFISKIKHLFGYVALGTGLVEIIVFIFSCLLARSFATIDR